MVKFHILLVAVVSVLVLESATANALFKRSTHEVSHSNNNHEEKHHETSQEKHNYASEEDSKEEELSHELEEEEEDEKSLETYLGEFRGLLDELKDILHEFKYIKYEEHSENDEEEIEEHENGHVEMIEIKIPEYIPHETEEVSKKERKD